MLKNLKMKVARKFYDVPATAYLSDGDINDACILTALAYAVVVYAILGGLVLIMGFAMAIAQAFGR